MVDSDTILGVAGTLTPFLYGVASLIYIVHFVKGNTLAGRLSTPSLILSIVSHIGYSVLFGIKYNRHPMATVFEVFSMVALSIALVYLIIQLWRKNRSTGVFVLPFVTVIALVSRIGMGKIQNQDINSILSNSYFGIHTGSITMAYSAFFLSAVYGVMLLWFHRVLRKKKFGLIFERLPSLDTLARMNRGATVVGFVFLSLSLITGMVWALDDNPGSLLSPRVISAFLIWFVFGFSIASHYLFKWSNRRVAIFMLFGFFTLIISSVAVNTFLADWHVFGV